MVPKAQLNNAFITLPDLNRTFNVEMGGSGVNIGAVLLEESDGVLRLISFNSRTLTDAGRTHIVQKGECLAVVFPLKKLLPYLEYIKLKVHCDHSSLVWIFKTLLTSKQVMPWGHRLQRFNCTMRYRHGRTSIPADLLSRHPVQYEEAALLSFAEERFFIETRESEIQIRLETVAVNVMVVTVLGDNKALLRKRDTFLPAIVEYIEAEMLPDDYFLTKKVQNIAQRSERSYWWSACV